MKCIMLFAVLSGDNFNKCIRAFAMINDSIIFLFKYEILFRHLSNM